MPVLANRTATHVVNVPLDFVNLSERLEPQAAMRVLNPEEIDSYRIDYRRFSYS